MTQDKVHSQLHECFPLTYKQKRYLQQNYYFIDNKFILICWKLTCFDVFAVKFFTYRSHEVFNGAPKFRDIEYSVDHTIPSL